MSALRTIDFFLHLPAVPTLLDMVEFTRCFFPLEHVTLFISFSPVLYSNSTKLVYGKASNVMTKEGCRPSFPSHCFPLSLRPVTGHVLS